MNSVQVALLRGDLATHFRCVFWMGAAPLSQHASPELIYGLHDDHEVFKARRHALCLLKQKRGPHAWSVDPFSEARHVGLICFQPQFPASFW